MTTSVAWRIARRELRGGLKGFRVFLACLALGVAAIAAVGTVRDSIERGLSDQGAVILGGDAEIQLTYRYASGAERAWMAATANRVSEVVEFRSMAVVGNGDTAQRGLTQIKAVDDAYPLYGKVGLDPPMPVDEALIWRGGLPSAVMAPLLVERLGLKIGDRFRLGTQDFVLGAILTHEPDNGGGGFSLGPTTIVRTKDLAQSGLLQPGTLFETAYRLALPAGTDLDAVEAAANKAIEGGGLRWRDSRNAAPGVTRFVDRLGNFLILVGLAGLAVGGVGISAAVRTYLDEKVPVIATLKSLGAEGRTIMAVYAIQIGLLAILGVVIGVALGGLIPVLLGPVINAQLPVPAVFGIAPVPLAEAAIYGLLTAALFTLWPLSRSGNIRAATLFRDAALGASGRPALRHMIIIGLLLMLLVGLAAVFSGQIKLTLWAAGGLLGAFLTLVVAAAGLRRLARRLAKAKMLRGRTAFRLALASVGGPGGEATSVILSLGLGLSVLAAVGQIDANLRNAIATELPDVAPSYFVVDIQKDQIDGYKARLASDPGVSRVEAAPMLRGVITQFNGRPAAELAGDHWVISGDRGITYSTRPPKGTEVTAGTWWPADYAGPPQVSFAADEAKEIGLKLGDTVTVNILGRDITTTVTSFRAVDFSNAGMGFVMTMDPAALQAAPHTYISTIYASQASEVTLLRDLTTAYPNITMISVRDAISQVAAILSGIAAAITYGAMAALVTGVVVLIGAAAAGERARTYEAAVLKTLGASRVSVLLNFTWRSVLLGAAAGLVAIFAGGMAGWAVCTYVMETAYHFEVWSALLIVLSGIVATALAGLWFSFRSLNARPARILRARE